MEHQLITFRDALKLSSDTSRRHLLTGNGFSIACRSNIFRYDSLFEQADFTALNDNIKNVFEALATKDFEIVMRQLKKTAEVLRIYAPHQRGLIEQLLQDAEDLKNVLVNAIASSHPLSPSDINEEEYLSCKTFLNNFGNIYTLNYDLLLYWTLMHYQELGEIKSDDGFRTPDSGKTEYVSWDIEKTNGQNIFYLHGALHIFDAGSELQKYTWINTGIKLIEQIRSALDQGLFPLFVSEGKSIEKVEKIAHSNYLSRGLRSFSAIGGSLFLYGHSLDVNDSHILNLIPKSKINKLFISIFGDITSKTNQEIVLTAEKLASSRRANKPLMVYYYDAVSAQVWR